MYFTKTKQLIKESKKIQDDIISLEMENIENEIKLNSYFELSKDFKFTINNIYERVAETRKEHININLNRGF